MTAPMFKTSDLITCSLIGSLVETWSVLKMSTALCVLHPDWGKVLLVYDRTHDQHIIWSIFSLGKVVNIFHFFKTILFVIFHKIEQMILFFCCVWIRSINCVSLIAQEMIKIQGTYTMLMLIQCTHLRYVHWRSINISGCALDWNQFFTTMLTHLLTYNSF